MQVVVDIGLRGVRLVGVPAFWSQSLKVVCTVGNAFRRVPVNYVVCQSPVFNNVIVALPFIVLCLVSLVFSQVFTSVRVVGEIDLVNCSGPVCRQVQFVLVLNVGQ